MAKIVVGVDGSEVSQRALEWAVDEARLRGAEVVALHAYRSEWIYYPEYVAVRTIVTPTDLAAEAEALLTKTIENLGDKTDGITILPEAVNDSNPAHALLERSGDADMIVVGSRGLGGFTGLLLGSVSQKVAHHAKVPVVIIPPVNDEE